MIIVDQFLSCLSVYDLVLAQVPISANFIFPEEVSQFADRLKIRTNGITSAEVKANVSLSALRPDLTTECCNLKN